MDRWLKEREKLSHKLEKMRLKRRRLHAEKGQASRKLVEDMDDQIENLTSNVNYLQENIVECQQNIMQMENAEEMGKTIKLFFTKFTFFCEINFSKYFFFLFAIFRINDFFFGSAKSFF